MKYLILLKLWKYFISFIIKLWFGTFKCLIMKFISLLTDGTFNVMINNEYISDKISSSLFFVISAGSILLLLIVLNEDEIFDDDDDEIGLFSTDDLISCNILLSNNEFLSFSLIASGAVNKLFLIGLVNKAEEGLHEEISNVFIRFWPF